MPDRLLRPFSHSSYTGYTRHRAVTRTHRW